LTWLLIFDLQILLGLVLHPPIYLAMNLSN